MKLIIKNLLLIRIFVLIFGVAISATCVSCDDSGGNGSEPYQNYDYTNPNYDDDDDSEPFEQYDHHFKNESSHVVTVVLQMYEGFIPDKSSDEFELKPDESKVASAMLYDVFNFEYSPDNLVSANRTGDETVFVDR